MTDEPLLNPLTRDQLTAVISKMPHALLLSGPTGIGKLTVARWLASQWLSVTVANVTDQPGYHEIDPPVGKAIGIEEVRELEHILSLKMPTVTAVNRVIVIANAHLLTPEAQNAILKTLEEPPAGTVLLLTAPQQDTLLPTIQSRLQVVEIMTPAADAVERLLAQSGVRKAELAGIMSLSGGLPGLATALAAGDEDHPLVQAAHTARQLLQQSAFDKLSLVESLAKNREAAASVLQILSQMSHAAILTGRNSDRWQKIMQATYTAQLALQKGAQPKLVLSNLMLNL